jgi:hypothetical protein
MRTQDDPYAIALRALGATLAEHRRAQRFLDLTGISAEALRSSAGSPALLVALLSFLEAHEPDLLAVAAEIGIEPAALVAARRGFEEGSDV